MFRRIATRLAFAVFAVMACVRPSFAGKKVYVGGRVPPTQQVSMDQIDHRNWDALLRKYVDQDGLVNYRDWKASANDMQVLDAYLQTLSKANPAAPAKRESQLSFWINAYNAVTVRGMLREYPTETIRNHTAKLVGYNIWHDFQLVVGEKPYSLDQMEHKLLRKMGEPRIHFAIVCASIGCPRLLNEAYVPNRIAEQLERNTRDFFSRPQNFRHDESKGRFYLSAILSWFGTDFGSNQASQLKKMSSWLPTPAAQQAAAKNTVSVEFLDYDWKLNAQRSVSAATRR